MVGHDSNWMQLTRYHQVGCEERSGYSGNNTFDFTTYDSATSGILLSYSPLRRLVATNSGRGGGGGPGAMPFISIARRIDHR